MRAFAGRLFCTQGRVLGPHPFNEKPVTPVTLLVYRHLRCYTGRYIPVTCNTLDPLLRVYLLSKTIIPVFLKSASRNVRGMMVRGMKTTDFLRFIPLTIIPLTDPSDAMRRVHWGILAQRAEIVHFTVVRIFLTRSPYKH